MSFWNVLKEVSSQPVREEARRLFVLALAGNPDAVAAARTHALGGHAGPAAAAAEPFLYCVSPPYGPAEENQLRHADLIVSLPGGPGITEFRPAETVLVERPDRLVQLVLGRRPDLRVALARRLPGFRSLASEQVIREVSRINAEFAAVSGISGAIPVLAPLFPALAGTDILVLTKNQVMMVFRLAAIHGEELDFKSRLREVAPVIGGAFGWRAIARELAGLLPGGLGIPMRAAIAYSGTYAVGRATEFVFDEGRAPTRREMRRIYEEGTALARETAGRLKERFTSRGGRSLPPPQKALPTAAVVLDETPDEELPIAAVHSDHRE